MTPRETDSTVPIGLIGLGPAGACHLERISLRDDLKVVVACDENIEPRHPQPGSPIVVSQVGDLLGRSDLEWALIAAPLSNK